MIKRFIVKNKWRLSIPPTAKGWGFSRRSLNLNQSENTIGEKVMANSLFKWETVKAFNPHLVNFSERFNVAYA